MKHSGNSAEVVTGLVPEIEVVVGLVENGWKAFLSQWGEMGAASILSEKDVHVGTSYPSTQVISVCIRT